MSWDRRASWEGVLPPSQIASPFLTSSAKADSSPDSSFLGMPKRRSRCLNPTFVIQDGASCRNNCARSSTRFVAGGDELDKGDSLGIPRYPSRCRKPVAYLQRNVLSDMQIMNRSRLGVRCQKRRLCIGRKLWPTVGIPASSNEWRKKVTVTHHNSCKKNLRFVQHLHALPCTGPLGNSRLTDVGKRGHVLTSFPQLVHFSLSHSRYGISRPIETCRVNTSSQYHISNII
jgi:hypothetical protein